MKPLRPAALLLVALVVLTGCGEVEPTPAAPSTTAPATSSPVGPAGPVSPGPTADLGSEGLNVRYLDEDGNVKTLRVEDFPR